MTTALWSCTGGAFPLTSGTGNDGSLLQRALLAVKDLRARVEAAERERSGPVAVIGLACRLPAAPDAAAFWRLLRDGVDAIREVPADRWDAAALYDPDPARSGTICTHEGGFLEAVDRFDAAFFGIAPREASRIDPQHRLLLEVAWEALEDAGQTLERLDGSPTGVFVGISINDYAELIRAGGPEALDPYFATGNALNAAAGRISYAFGLRGPCVCVDTACSSSLTAVHLACQSLRTGESRLALAGGVNLILAPDAHIAMSRARALSPDGRCKTFDRRADGYGRSEGCGVVVLKRLGDALADGDPILAMIRGSAVRQDGRSGGLTVPNGAAQQEVIRAALAQAGVRPADVGYLEAHGTGTSLGDPIEVRALGAVLSEGRTADRPLYLGAVKTNVGHLESAAGVTSLIKVVLSLRHREIPPHLHLREVNPDIDLEAIPAIIPRERTPWPAIEGRRLAGVSAFGLTGTIAHAIVEEAPVEAAAAAESRGAWLLPISARAPEALRALAAAWRDLLRRSAAPPLADLIHTAGLRRSHHDHRAAVVGLDGAGLAEALEAFLAGEPHPGLVVGVRPPDRRRVAFVFPGQGGQWPGMARDLLAIPAFRDALAACDAALRPEVGWSLLESIERASPLDCIDVVQPMLFGVEVALAALWRSFGVEPEAVIGHSMGEVAAAHVAGALSLEDAARIIARRSRLLRRTAGRGAMAVLELGLVETEAAIAPVAAEVSVAASNSPRSTVISGAPDAVASVLATLEGRGIFCRPVKVDAASHSPQMDPLRAELLDALAGVRPRAGEVPMYSTVTGVRTDGAACNAAYWASNIREPVRFAQALDELVVDGHDLLVEMSPHPTLAIAAAEILRARGRGQILTSLRRDEPGPAALLSSLGSLWAAGGQVDWRTVAPPGRVVPLPAYPWQRERFWVEPTTGEGRRVVRRFFPGERVFSPALDGALFRTTLGVATLPFLADHRIDGEVVVPGACHLSLLISSALAVSGETRCAAEDVRFPSALVLGDDESCEAQVSIAKDGAFRVMAGKEQTWTLHATGRVRPAGSSPAEPARLDDVRGRCGTHRTGAEFYEEMWRAGYHLGPTFRWIEEIWCREGEALGRMRASAGTEYAVFPGLLDSCFQLIGAASQVRGIARLGPDTLYVPVGARRLSFHRRPAGETWCHVAVSPGQADELGADVRLVDSGGAPFLEVAFLGKCVRKDVFLRADQERPRVGFFRREWITALRPRPSATTPGRWLLIADRRGIATRLARALEERGERCRIGALPERSEPLRGIVHLTSLDAADFARTDPAALTEARRLGCESVLALLQRIVDPSAPRLWLITAGAQAAEPSEKPLAVAQAPLWGLARTIAHERVDLRATCVDLPADPGSTDVSALADELLADDREDQIAIRGDRRLVARLARWSDETPRRAAVPAGDVPFGLAIDAPGVLENLELRAVPRPAPRAGEVEIEVHAAGLNFVDVLSALGVRPDRVEGPVLLGGECAGVVSAVGEGVADLRVGDPVIAVAPHCFRRFVTASSRFAVPKPARIGFEEAATLPIAFMTAHWAMHHMGRLQAGERILIHAASGGVGLAAVQLARRLGLEILATAGSPEKRAYLRGLGIRHVMDSRTLDFADEVMAATAGAGVDAVLNSLTGDALARSLTLLAPHGRFLEIGKRDIYQDTRLGLWPFHRNLSYFAVDLIRMFSDRPEDCAALLREVVDLAGQSAIEPLPRTVFLASKAVDAFRLMAQAKHIGKIVLSLHDPEARIRLVPAAKGLGPDASYLITGGLGGLGLTVARWMVDHGARHLALVGRGAPGAGAREAVTALEAQGARVLVGRADVSRPDELAAFLAEADRNLPPLRGVVHAAGILDDGLLAKLDPERLRAVMEPKVEGAWNLHAALAGREIDFFVLFSSASAVLGSPGQGNYAAANAFLDALAHARRAAGLPALAIDWGPWSEVGLAARPDRGGRLALRGIASLTPAQGAEAFGRLLCGVEPQVAVLSIDLQQCFQHYPLLAEAPLFASLAAEATEGPTAAPFRKTLLEAPAGRRLALLEDHLRHETARVLGLPPARLDKTRPLGSLGLDSLMALELRNRLEAGLGLKLSATLVWNHPTLAALAEHLARRLQIPLEEAPPREHDTDLAKRVEQLSDEQAAEILAERLRLLEMTNPQ
jgi:acyl transferase domain-containing protein/acyl carrier protein